MLGKRRFKVNNKEKQYAGSNWSADKFTKEHTTIAEPLYPEDRHRGLKRKRVKRDVLPWTLCPFCGEELREIATKSWWCRREKKCRHCGAKKGKLCPCCKGETWFKEGVYKHQWHGCGFEGKKLRGRSRL